MCCLGLLKSRAKEFAFCNISFPKVIQKGLEIGLGIF